MENISINARSSIRIEGTKVIYFDPFKNIDIYYGKEFDNF